MSRVKKRVQPARRLKLRNGCGDAMGEGRVSRRREQVGRRVRGRPAGPDPRCFERAHYVEIRAVRLDRRDNRRTRRGT